MMRKPDAQFGFSRERDIVPSLPVVSGSSCYFESAGSADELIRIALDDGNIIWRRPSNNFFPVAVGVDRIFLMSSTHAIATTEDGAEVWRVAAGFNTWDVWRELAVFTGATVKLLDATSGQPIGSIESPKPIKIGMTSGQWFLGFSPDGTQCAAFDLVERAVAWSADLRPVFDSVPQLGSASVAKAKGAGDIFVLSTRGHLFGFSASSGKLLWRAPARNTTAAPAITNDRVYSWHFGPARTPAHLVCLDLHSGELIFDRDLAGNNEAFKMHLDPHNPLVHPRVVVLSSRQGLICGCSPDGGEPMWQYHHKAGLGSSALAGDALIILTRDSQLLRFDLASGSGR